MCVCVYVCMCVCMYVCIYVCDTISPEPALEEFRCKITFDQECSCDGFRPLIFWKMLPWRPLVAKNRHQVVLYISRTSARGFSV